MWGPVRYNPTMEEESEIPILMLDTNSKISLISDKINIIEDKTSIGTNMSSTENDNTTEMNRSLPSSLSAISGNNSSSNTDVLSEPDANGLLLTDPFSSVANVDNSIATDSSNSAEVNSLMAPDSLSGAEVNMLMPDSFNRESIDSLMITDSLGTAELNNTTMTDSSSRPTAVGDRLLLTEPPRATEVNSVILNDPFDAPDGNFSTKTDSSGSIDCDIGSSTNIVLTPITCLAQVNNSTEDTSSMSSVKIGSTEGNSLIMAHSLNMPEVKTSIVTDPYSTIEFISTLMPDPPGVREVNSTMMTVVSSMSDENSSIITDSSSAPDVNNIMLDDASSTPDATILMTPDLSRTANLSMDKIYFSDTDVKDSITSDSCSKAGVNSTIVIDPSTTAEMNTSPITDPSSMLDTGISLTIDPSARTEINSSIISRVNATKINNTMTIDSASRPMTDVSSSIATAFFSMPRQTVSTANSTTPTDSSSTSDVLTCSSSESNINDSMISDSSNKIRVNGSTVYSSMITDTCSRSEVSRSSLSEIMKQPTTAADSNLRMENPSKSTCLNSSISDQINITGVTSSFIAYQPGTAEINNTLVGLLSDREKSDLIPPSPLDAEREIHALHHSGTILINKTNKANTSSTSASNTSSSNLKAHCSDVKLNSSTVNDDTNVINLGGNDEASDTMVKTTHKTNGNTELDLINSTRGSEKESSTVFVTPTSASNSNHLVSDTAFKGSVTLVTSSQYSADSDDRLLCFEQCQDTEVSDSIIAESLSALDSDNSMHNNVSGVQNATTSMIKCPGSLHSNNISALNNYVSDENVNVSLMSYEPVNEIGMHISTMRTRQTNEGKMQHVTEIETGGLLLNQNSINNTEQVDLSLHDFTMDSNPISSSFSAITVDNPKLFKQSSSHGERHLQHIESVLSLKASEVSLAMKSNPSISQLKVSTTNARIPKRLLKTTSQVSRPNESSSKSILSSNSNGTSEKQSDAQLCKTCNAGGNVITSRDLISTTDWLMSTPSVYSITTVDSLTDEPQVTTPSYLNDVILIVDGGTLYSSRAILSYSSPVIKSMLTSPIRRGEPLVVNLCDKLYGDVEELLLCITPGINKVITGNAHIYLHSFIIVVYVIKHPIV